MAAAKAARIRDFYPEIQFIGLLIRTIIDNGTVERYWIKGCFLSSLEGKNRAWFLASLALESLPVLLTRLSMHAVIIYSRSDLCCLLVSG